MNTAEVVTKLREMFAGAVIHEETFRGQTTLELRKDSLKDVLRYLKDKEGPGYQVLMDLTGVDYLHPEKHTKVLYHLHNPKTLQRLRLFIRAIRDDAIPSVTDIWEGADWYERELYDMFGVNFIGHPDMKRILMPDDWRGHPLRKDYSLTEESVEFKHGVKPKVPSEIIPYAKKITRS